MTEQELSAELQKLGILLNEDETWCKCHVCLGWMFFDENSRRWLHALAFDHSHINRRYRP